MRNFKRFLTLALAVLMVVSAFAFSTSAATFADVDEDNETLVKAVNLLAHVGVTKGYDDTTFGTEDLVTREQMAAFIYRLMKKGKSVEGGVNQSPFTDLEDETFFFMVSWANSQNIIKGTSATTFNPKGSITLQDAYTMLVRALGYETEEALPYPFGYIEIAEGEGVELDEGLDSSVGYTDELTRGDVAILLYNTFFAETGVAETVQDERQIGGVDENGDGDFTDANDIAPSWVLENVTKYPVFCEKYFDVKELKYQAVATNNNYLAGPAGSTDATETTKNLGYDAIEFKHINVVGDYEYATPSFYGKVEELGLENSDDYFLSHFRMYITFEEEKDANGNVTAEVKDILYAEPLMTKKTTSDIKLETLAGATKEQFYGKNPKAAKNLSGKVIIDGEAAYFYNAPYSYAKPSYANAKTAYAKYLARNNDNIQVISRQLNNTIEDGDYKWTNNGGIVSTSAVTSTSYGFQTESELLIGLIPEAYVDGYYEADLYDVDGDGRYEYIDYKPYSYAIIDTEDDYSKEKLFFNNKDKGGLTDKNGTVGVAGDVLFTNGANVEGAEFADEDVVIAYLDADSNYVKVIEVIEPVNGKIADISANKGAITLDNETKADVKGGWKLHNYIDVRTLKAANYVVDDYNWVKYNSLLNAAAYSAPVDDYYVYDGALIYKGNIASHNVLGQNLAIVSLAKGQTGIIRDSAWQLGEMVNYVYAWIDGELMYIPVQGDAQKTGIAPALNATTAGQFLNKVAEYTVDKNGVYSLKLIGNATEYGSSPVRDLGISKTANLADTKDNTIQKLEEKSGTYALVKDVANRYTLVNVTDNDANNKAAASELGANALAYQLLVSDDTKIIIRNEYTDDVTNNTKIEWHTLGLADLKENIENILTNVQLVVSNNTDSRARENLVLLFAEANGAKLDYAGNASKKDERIVKGIETKKDADGDKFNVYTLLNPYTGETEEVEGSETNFTTQKLVGDVVTIKSGKVDETAAVAASHKFLNANNIWWIVGYDAEANFIEIAKFNAKPGDAETPGVNDTFDDDDAVVDSIEEIEEAGFAEYYVLSLDDAAVTTIGNQKASFNADMIKFNDLTVVSASELATNSALKAVNTGYAVSDTDTIRTLYAKYLKAYVEIDWENDANHNAKDEDNMNGKAKFAVVIATDAEDAAYCIK